MGGVVDILAKVYMFFANFRIAFMAFLLVLFPNWGNLQFTYLQQTNNITRTEFISIIDNKDVDTLEKKMCKNIKDNVPELRNEISKMLDAVDGKIDSASFDTGASFTGNREDGRAIHQSTKHFYFVTVKGTHYKGHILFETANSFNKEEAGIRQIALYSGEVKLGIITATDGILNWHD